MSRAILEEHTTAVIAALRAADIVVGDADAPDNDDLELPYCVLYPIPGGRMTGSLEDPNEDATLVYQPTCVGESRKQAEWMVDKVIDVFLSNAIQVEDRSIAQVDIDLNAGVRPERDVSPAVFYATPRFTILSTPA